MPKVPPQIAPSSAPIQDKLSSSNSSVMNDPSLGHVGNIQPQPLTSEIPQDIDQKMTLDGVNLKDSASSQRGRTRVRRPPSPDITDFVDSGNRRKAIDIIDLEGKLIKIGSIESGVKVEDGLGIRGNDNGENLITLKDATVQKTDTLMPLMGSSAILGSLAEDDNVKTFATEKTMLPISQHQPQEIAHDNVEREGPETVVKGLLETEETALTRIQTSSTKGKRKLEDSRSENDWTDDDSPNHETVNDERPVTSQKGTGTKFGQGRGRSRRRRRFRLTLKRRVVRTTKRIARKVTHANIPNKATEHQEQLERAEEEPVIPNKAAKHQEQLEHDEEEPVIVLEPEILERVRNWETKREPEMLGVKSGFTPPAPQPHLQYTDEEKKILYGDQCFVVDMNDYGKDPENMFIWQIHEGGRYLRQYYPSKFAGRQFHSSTPVTWLFFEEDFKSEAFYKRFQPIVVIVAGTKVCFSQTRDAATMVERIVQFVYIDKIFFAQMAKHLGRIHKTEHLRSKFMESLPVYTMTAIVPQFIKVVTVDDSECYKKFKPYLADWQVISLYINATVEQACNTSDMSKETFAYLKHFPDLSYSIKHVKKKNTCSACSGKGRKPVVRAIFGLKNFRPRPYNFETLQELSADEIPKLPDETLYWCQTCSRAAKIFHRFYHFRYSMYRIVQQYVVKNVALFKKCRAEISDAILIWIIKNERSWQNAVSDDDQ